jgi:PTH1 family peptidyl-tRNA hydrolase
MALFQKKPIEVSKTVPYTIGLATSYKLIVGLGNPGKQYELTRHNIGFRAIDYFAKNQDFPEFSNVSKFKGLFSEKIINNQKIILAKPQTYMNDSGQSVRAVADYYRISPENIVVVYDELAVIFGTIRTRLGGQAAGHNGIKSIINHLESNFYRLRIGIKSDLSSNIDASDFVLGKFSKEEEPKIPQILSESTNILTEYIYGGSFKEETRKVL